LCFMSAERRAEGDDVMAGRKQAVKLTKRTVKMYLNLTGETEIRCASCGRKLNVGDRIVKHGKFNVPEKNWKLRKFLYFECESCWSKRFYDFEEPTEEEIEKLEVLTIPFYNLERLMLC